MTPQEVFREASLRALAHLLAGYGLKHPDEFIDEIVWEDYDWEEWWEADLLIEETKILMEEL